MTWGVNFGLDNATNAVNMAKSILKAFATSAVNTAGVTLELIEVGKTGEKYQFHSLISWIGNEADLYKNNGLRPSNWTQAQYVTE